MENFKNLELKELDLEEQKLTDGGSAIIVTNGLLIAAYLALNMLDK